MHIFVANINIIYHPDHLTIFHQHTQHTPHGFFISMFITINKKQLLEEKMSRQFDPSYLQPAAFPAT